MSIVKLGNKLAWEASRSLMISRSKVLPIPISQFDLGLRELTFVRSFAVLADMPLQLNEEGQSIVVATTGESTAFVVGTAFVDPAEPEPTKGRLLVLAEETERRAFDQVNEIEIGGCPYALASAGSGHVAAAINSQVSHRFERYPCRRHRS